MKPLNQFVTETFNPVVTDGKSDEILAHLRGDLLPNAPAVMAQAIKVGYITVGSLTSMLPPTVTRDRAKLAKLIQALTVVFKKVIVQIRPGEAEPLPLEKVTQEPVRKDRKIERLRDLIEDEDGDEDIDLKGLEPGPVLELVDGIESDPDKVQRSDSYTTDPLLEYYFRLIGPYSNLLTKEKEAELGILASSGDIEARNTLALYNTWYVVKIARRYAGRGVDIHDLIQVGNLGVIRAAEDFDPKKGRFTTYATWWIKSYIKRYLTEHSRPVRYPQYLHDQRAQLSKIERELVVALGREPTKDELKAKARHLNNLDDVLAMISDTIVHLDDSLEGSKGGETSIHDLILDENSASPVIRLEAKERLEHSSKRIRELVATVKAVTVERNFDIFCSYYGLNGKPEGSTLEYVGSIYGLTRERTCQIVADTWQKITIAGIPFDDKSLCQELGRTQQFETVANTEADIIPSEDELLDAIQALALSQIAQEDSIDDEEEVSSLIILRKRAKKGFDVEIRIITSMLGLVEKDKNIPGRRILECTREQERNIRRLGEVIIFLLREDFSIPISELCKFFDCGSQDIWKICKKFSEEYLNDADIIELIAGIRAHYSITWYEQVCELTTRQKNLFGHQREEIQSRISTLESILAKVTELFNGHIAHPQWRAVFIARYGLENDLTQVTNSEVRVQGVDSGEVPKIMTSIWHTFRSADRNQNQVTFAESLAELKKLREFLLKHPSV